MADDSNETPEELSARERARVRHRDRKRTTTMVVDNAGVKRTAAALAARRAAQAPAQAAKKPQKGL